MTLNLRTGWIKLLAAAIILLCLSPSIRAQGLGSEAIAFFPPDTQQVAYADLSQLRALPDYKQLRQALFSQEMKNLEAFLRSIGDDPEEDVNEVILGAEGSFDPDQVQNLAAKGRLPSRDYAGYILADYGFGKSNGLYLTYLSSNLAAFGRLNDLETLIDDYSGKRLSLSSKPDFVNWEAELEGSGSQWGVTTGAAAANIAAPWLGDNSKSPVALGSLLKPVKAVLYKVNWSGEFDAQISVICDNSQDAQTLERLLMLGQSALPATPGMSPSIAQFIHSLQISIDGDRLELEGSGPPQLITEIVQGGK
jgi:hypothetical protein